MMVWLTARLARLGVRMPISLAGAMARLHCRLAFKGLELV